MNKQKDRLTTDKTKIFVRENITLMSVTKDELRRHYNEIFDRLQEYEVAEETGQIIAPSCKVGDLVYALWEAPIPEKYVVYAAEVKEISIRKRNCRLAYTYKVEPLCFAGRIKEYLDEDFGKLIFLIKEEAEAKLKEGEQ